MGKHNKKRRSDKQRTKIRKRKEYLRRRFAREGKPIAPSLHYLSNPFSDLSEEVRKQALKQVAQTAEEKYGIALAQIREIFSQYDPTQLLSTLATYGLYPSGNRWPTN